jgi:hypothetical protein
MDYFQGVVTEYLRANRATFVNTECLIQLALGDSPKKGEHWFCDVVAINFAERAVYLCEVSYSTTLYSLGKRLEGWAANWLALKAALCRDCSVPEDWSVRPWVFIPRDLAQHLQKKLATLGTASSAKAMTVPRVTHLEDVVPWKYPSWNRKLEELAKEAP